MRVGIITFHTSINYGAVLQCYALSRFLRECGHEVEVIDYHRASPKWKGVWERPLMNCPNLVVRKIHTLLRKRNRSHRERVFGEFVAHELPLTEHRYVGVEGLRENPPDCEVYICGSDQIWNDRFWDGFNEAYFLKFGGKDVLRIAYAPGVPGAEFKRCEAGQFQKLISNFDALSAREDIGQKLIEEAVGSSVPIVADPTILFGKFEEVVKPVETPARYILSYGLSRQTESAPSVDECTAVLGERTGLPVIPITMEDRVFGRQRVYTPLEWLWLIKNATYFVTNSYHGLIFALLFQRDFVVVPRDGDPDGQDARLLFLLRRYGLSGHYIPSIDRLDGVPAVNWDSVSLLLTKERLFSRNYLEKALSLKPTTCV